MQVTITNMTLKSEVVVFNNNATIFYATAFVFRYWFLAILKTCFVSATCSFALFAWFNRPNQLSAIMGVTAVTGFFCFGLLPVALELGVEITYPVSEATSSGFLWLSGQAFGIAFTLAMSALKGEWFVHKPEAFGPDVSNATACGDGGPPKTMEGACWFMVGCGVLACAFALPLYTK
jgi:FLVCR family MFS transporter 7